MFGTSKKLAASMAELLIILAIVGILAVLYRNTINEDAIATKAGYRNVLNNMIAFASTETTVNNPFDRPFGLTSICDRMFKMVNTLGDVNCEYSMMPVVPNFTTTSGMRFFGLEQIFLNHDTFGERSIFLTVDIDGLMGPNTFEGDIFPIELMQSGRIRPAGSAIFNNGANRNPMKGNVARDAELYAINLSFIPSGATTKDDFKVIGNRISYAEAQCLGGNPFPYRDANPPHELQMCIEDEVVRNAINAFNPSISPDDRPDIEDLNGDGNITSADRDEEIRRYRRALALEEGEENLICSGLYTDEASVAYGLTSINETGIRRCGYCYKIAYIEDYCSSPDKIWTNPNAQEDARVKIVDANGDEICPDAIINAEITDEEADGATPDENDNVDKSLRNAMCSMPEWAEMIQ